MTGSHHQSCSNKKSPLPTLPRKRGGQGGRKEWVMVTIRNEMPFDIDAREDLLDRVWGASRFQKTAERLREGREPSAGLSFVAILPYRTDQDLKRTRRSCLPALQFNYRAKQQTTMTE
jgi:hypothetical protein